MAVTKQLSLPVRGMTCASLDKEKVRVAVGVF